MKISRFPSFSFTAAFGIAVFSFSSTAATAADQPGSPSGANPPIAPDPVVVTPTTGETNTWDDMKTMTFEQRPEFQVGLKKLETKLDNQIAGLNARRAKMKNNTAEWDFEMKVLNDARVYLKSLSSEVNETTAELWDGEKEKIQRAWQSAQDSYDRVKTSTTQT
jgi:hypothetical protein